MSDDIAEDSHLGENMANIFLLQAFDDDVDGHLSATMLAELSAVCDT